LENEKDKKKFNALQLLQSNPNNTITLRAKPKENSQKEEI